MYVCSSRTTSFSFSGVFLLSSSATTEDVEIAGVRIKYTVPFVGKVSTVASVALSLQSNRKTSMVNSRGTFSFVSLTEEKEEGGIRRTGDCTRNSTLVSFTAFSSYLSYT